MTVLQVSCSETGFWLWSEGPLPADLLSQLEIPVAPTAIMVWLPASQGQPVPSVGSPPGQPISLQAFSVDGVALAAQALVDLFTRLPVGPVLRPGVLIGASLRYWQRLLQVAANLVARERFLPGLAGWEPVVTGPDSTRLAALAQAMPHCCRCVGSAQPQEAALSMTRRALTHLLHAVVVSAFPPRPLGENLHDAWLAALAGGLGPLPGDTSGLADAILQWRLPLTQLAEADYRLALRLSEPLGQFANWRVDYLLQSNLDPSLFLPAADAWSGATREVLLASLGLAARLSPLIEASLREATPVGCQTDTDGAFQFLSESSAALEQAGFGVLLPGFWSSKKRLGVRAKVASPPMQLGGQLKMTELLAVDWSLILGGQELTLEELQELAGQKRQLVQVRGQWVELRSDEVQAALSFFKKRRRSQLTLQEAMEIELGLDPLGSELAIEGLVSDGAVAEFLERLKGHESIQLQQAPDGFAGQLRPYQLRGYSWILFLRQFGLGACLADDMGLGKTVQTLAAIWQGLSAGEGPSLLVCPTSVLGNWQREAARFTPDLKVAVHHGSQRSNAEWADQGLILTSYSLLHRDVEHLAKVRWSAVILDEAQNIKNANAKQSQAARQLQADFRLALTGTPVENHVGDLWSLMEFLQPRLLGSRDAFKRNFFLPIQGGNDPGAEERLKRLTGPFVLRRLKTDRSILTDLPDKLELKETCPLTAEQASLYQAVVKEVMLEIEAADGMQRRGLVLSLLSRLKQICNHPAHYLSDHSALPNRSGKLTRLTELVEEILEVQERALIFTQYAEMGELLQRYLQDTFGREVLFLHGGLAKKVRDQQVERFQDGKVPLFLLSLKAGGTGLNLTAANHVFHFDRWWNPAVENQATDRAFRIGQKRHVQVHKFLCLGTVEEKIDLMIEKKSALAQKIVGTGENWLTELSSSDLRSLFQLSQAVV